MYYGVYNGWEWCAVVNEGGNLFSYLFISFFIFFKFVIIEFFVMRLFIFCVKLYIYQTYSNGILIVSVYDATWNIFVVFIVKK